METKFAVKVNGTFITNVAAKQDTSREEFVAFVKAYGVLFNEAKDTLEVERLDQPNSNNLIQFPKRGQTYMQVSHVAIETHIHNLIQTYGLSAVIGVFDRTVGIGRAS